LSNQHTPGAPCADFHAFLPIFTQRSVSARLRRKDGRIGDTSIASGDSFILYGMAVCVAEILPDSRARLICEDGTERNILLRSLRRTLYRDRGARRMFLVPEFDASAEAASVTLRDEA
jgi:hypothetical protein